MSSQNNRMSHPIAVHRGSQQANKVAANPLRDSWSVAPAKLKFVTLERLLRRKAK